MAKFEPAPIFQSISGALTKINKKSQHAADQKMVLCTHRVAPTTSPDCLRVYLRDLQSVTRTTEPTQDEQLIRNKFAAVSKAVNARMKDLTKMPQDQAAFKAQNTYKTFRQYLWALESKAYEG